jgi:ABC-type phosphate transport system substrate-binding protein
MNAFNPKRMLLAALSVVVFAGVASAADISGAGATFPYPVYSKWADAYKTQTGVGLNYQSIGSGGGIRQIKAKTVTFGASDMPLEQKDLAQAGLVQFPMIIGGVVPVVNLPGRDHQVERSAHPEGQSEARVAGHGHCAGVPLGRLRNELPVLQLPLERLSEIP